MRRIILMLVFLISLCSVTVLADNGDDYVVYYDFNNISGNNPTPDSNWSYRAKGGYTAEAQDEHGKVMEIQAWAEPVLTFSQAFETGILRIGADIKFPNTNSHIEFWLIDDIKNIVKTRVMPVRFKRDANDAEVIMYNPKVTYTGGATSDINAEWNSEEWNHVDIVCYLDENKADVYLNNNKITATAIDLNNINTFGGFNFRANEKNRVWFDNVTVSRATDSGLVMFNVTEGDKVLPLENAKLDIRLTEPVHEDAFNNLIVKHLKTGEEIKNFTVTKNDSLGYTINFDGAIPAGTYNISFNETVSGLTTGAKMEVPLEVRTVPDSVIIDGVMVIRPQVDEIVLYDYKDEIVSGAVLTSMIKSAKVTFSTTVDEASAKENVYLKKNGEKADCEKTITEENGKSILTLNFTKLLDGAADYSIGIDEAPGVGALGYPQVTSNEAFEVTFTTQDDESVLLFGKEEKDGNFCFKIAKNTDAKSYMTVALLEYEDKTCKIDGEEKTLKMLKNISYKAVKLEALDGGVIEYKMPAEFYNENTSKLLAWSYPGLLDITDTVIK